MCKEEKSKIIIELVDNGYVVTYNFIYDEDKVDKLCIQEREDIDEEEAISLALQDLLWQVKEYAGGMEGRYSKRRVMVRIEHGDKYECSDKDCEICAEARNRCPKCSYDSED